MCRSPARLISCFNINTHKCKHNSALTNAVSNDNAGSGSPTNAFVMRWLIIDASSRVIVRIQQLASTLKPLGHTAAMRASTSATMHSEGKTAGEPCPTLATNAAHIGSATARTFTVKDNGFVRGNQAHVLKQYAAGSFANLCTGNSCCMSPANKMVRPPNGASTSCRSRNNRSTASTAHLCAILISSQMKHCILRSQFLSINERGLRNLAATHLLV